jgi:hypothetical protein
MGAALEVTSDRGPVLVYALEGVKGTRTGES